MSDEVDAVGEILREAARVAILPRFRRLAAAERREKARGDVVTDADEEAERIITAGLLRVAPDSLVVGEEAAAANPSIIEAAFLQPDVWFVDPLDGTLNFASGIPFFATMVARVRNGRTIAAWIYDPLADRLIWARAGAGAWHDGKRLRVGAPGPLGSMSGFMALRFGDRPGAARIVERLGRVGSMMQLRCAGQEYAMLAEARVEFSVYRRLYPWDHAPGVLIHAEAGGHAAYFDGAPYRPDGPISGGGLLLAPDAPSWAALHRALIAP